MVKVAVVTGSSSGIGYETTLELARSGFQVYATMRNRGKAGQMQDAADKENLALKVAELDVDSDDSVQRAMGSILEETGERVDVLVNNAGYGLVGAVEDLSMDELKAQFETNFFGLVRATQAVLPAMRKQKSGTIVNVSSIAGRVAFPLSPAYSATKFAVEGLSEAMSHELAPFGIRVALVEPGMIRTNFASALVMAKKAADPAGSPYAPLVQKMYASTLPLLEKAAPAHDVAKAVLEAAAAPPDRAQFRYTVGPDAARLAAAAKAAHSDNEFLAKLRRSYGLAPAADNSEGAA